MDRATLEHNIRPLEADGYPVLSIGRGGRLDVDHEFDHRRLQNGSSAGMAPSSPKGCCAAVHGFSSALQRFRQVSEIFFCRADAAIGMARANWMPTQIGE